MTVQALDRRALGRTLTRLANAGTAELLRLPATTPAQRARRIGITGAPGAGKSTLVGRLALLRAAAGGGRTGVIAIDPSSPKSGGAILGDRIRIDELPGSAELYIRSLGSRAATDGLADNVAEMLDVMDCHGFTEVLLETVGVGQAEYAARAQVDTLLLVLLPDSGDAVQAMKAGIMEMADIFVVNKSDLAGASKMAADIRRIAAIGASHAAGAWTPPVLLTAAGDAASIAALSAAIDGHQAWLATQGRQPQLAEQRARYRLRRLLELRAAAVVARQDANFFAAPLERQLAQAMQLLARDAD